MSESINLLLTDASKNRDDAINIVLNLSFAFDPTMYQTKAT
jgi:hypothetical protein